MRNLKLVLFVLFTVVVVQFTSAQVDIQNKIEYSKGESEFEDINSITIPPKKIKKAKKEREISIDDLQRVVRKRRATRYRKIRKETEKCFKDVAEDKSCNKDIDDKLPRRKKK